MAFQDSNESIILSSVADYSTVSMLELMALTPGLDDDQVNQAVEKMKEKDLLQLAGKGADQFVSLTRKGHDYLSSLKKMQVAFS